jgi:hypothetical protein
MDGCNSTTIMDWWHSDSIIRAHARGKQSGNRNHSNTTGWLGRTKSVRCRRTGGGKGSNMDTSGSKRSGTVSSESHSTTDEASAQTSGSANTDKQSSREEEVTSSNASTPVSEARSPFFFCFTIVDAK